MSVTAALGIAKVGASIVDKLFTSDEEKATAKLKLMEMEQNGELQELATSAGVVEAEAKSEHWLTANWRPLTMLTFVAVIANNYLLYPYLSLFWPEAPMLEIPPDMWGLLKLGIGGYVMSRGGEKIAKEVGKVVGKRGR